MAPATAADEIISADKTNNNGSVLNAKILQEIKLMNTMLKISSRAINFLSVTIFNLERIEKLKAANFNI
uniref:Uncharacterized protein n=1 Tax=Romanomermis culicivorax TaxID=13658 RepID=A0A915J6Y7_ROMCU